MSYPDALAVIGGWGPRWAVVCGKWEDVLPTLPAGCVASAIFDPPYSEHVHSNSWAGAQKKPLKDGNGHLTRCAIKREVGFGFRPITQDEMEALADHCERLTTRWSTAFCDVESVHLWRGAFESAGLRYLRTCAWEKVSGTPQFGGDRPGVGFEAIVCVHRPGKSRWNGGGKLGVYRHLTCQERGGQKLGNNSRVHPTQKPLDLMLELVADFTDPDDLVIDMTCGSGTTGVACLRLGRRFIGIERKFEWAVGARERLALEEAGSTVKAARAGQLPLMGLAG